MYTIEKNIPLPETVLRNKTNNFPLNTMEVNDSFIAPKEKRSSIQAAAKKYGESNPGVKFATRVLENEVNIRVWRIA